MRILYLVGDSRSGSTLLQHLLSLQPGVHALGELRRLGALSRASEPCACGAPLGECEFWCDVCGETPAEARTTERVPGGATWRALLLREAAAIRGGLIPAGSLFRAKAHAVAQECFRLYEAVAAKTGAELLIDNSKEPDHFLHMHASYPEHVAPVFLHRDGRGILWSKMRRTGKSASDAIQGYVWMQRLIETARRGVGLDKATELRYEDLCQDPRAELERLLKPYGVPVETTDLGQLPDVRHDIGGSPTFKGAEKREIRLDERWREALPADALAEFERRAGRLNRFRGYKD
ncbi:MAG: sulfotransferase [Planctomycetes bacterium]|nr:sulfotransferase [Planctomycetota bacterium]